jgi:hypothetical protein
MGNTITVLVGYIMACYIKITQQTKALLWGELKQKNYFNNDILLKDDEQKAGKYY